MDFTHPIWSQALQKLIKRDMKWASTLHGKRLHIKEAIIGATKQRFSDLLELLESLGCFEALCAELREKADEALKGDELEACGDLERLMLRARFLAERQEGVSQETWGKVVDFFG